MKHIILISLMLFIGIAAQSQKFTYTYDANGNRIKRESEGTELFGKITYDNTASTILPNTAVDLKSGGNTLSSVKTNTNGSYRFFNIDEGQYNLGFTSNTTWGGVDPGDALMINRHYIGLYDFPDKLREKAADVSNDGFINPLDALFVSRRYIEIIDAFPAGDWIYGIYQDNDIDMSNEISLDVNSSLVTKNIKAICVGDVNGSYLNDNYENNSNANMNIANKFNINSTTSLRNHQMNNRFNNNYSNSSLDSGLITIVSIDSVAKKPGEEVILHLNVTNFNNISAFGFRIKYIDSVLTFMNISFLNPNVNIAPYSNIGDSVNIAWSSGSENSVNIGDTVLLELKFHYNGGSTSLSFLPASMVADDNLEYLDITFKNGFIYPATPPTITIQPENVTKCINDSLSFSVTATGTAPLLYQWYKIVNSEELIVNAATNSQFTIHNSQLNDVGDYKCVVSNISDTIISNPCRLYINKLFKANFSLPVTACKNDSTAFINTSEYCLSDLTYNWDFGNATTSSLRNPKIIYGDTGIYNVKLIISNTMGTKDSITKTIHITDYCNIFGTLISGANCGSNAAANDTLVLKDIHGNIYNSIPPAITDNSGNFIFDLYAIHSIDSTKYRIDLLRGAGVEDTNARTIIAWKNRNPVALQLRNVVQEWITSYGKVDTSSSASALDLHNNIYVSGKSWDNNTYNTPITTIKYGPDGIRKWIANYRDSIDDYFTKSMTVDNNCNIYILGSKSPAYWIENGGEFEAKFVVLKYDSTGNLLWYKYCSAEANPQSTASSIILDKSGNIYVNGIMCSGFDESGWMPTRIDYYTIKFDSTSEQLWVNSFGEDVSSGWNPCVSMGIDSSDNIYVSGTINNVINTVKYDADGTQQWQTNDSLNVNAFIMRVDVNGNTYLAPLEAVDNVVLKLNSSGIKQWSVNGLQDAKIAALTLDNSGNIYVSGLNSVIDGTASYSTSKHNANGVELWNIISENKGYSPYYMIYADIDINNNLYLANRNNSTNETTSPQLTSQYYLTKYSAEGDELWETYYKSDSLCESWLSGLKVSPNNNIYLIGTDIKYDSIVDYTAYYSYSGISTIKYSQCPETAHLLKQMGKPDEKQSVKKYDNTLVNLYPNPNDGSFNLDIILPAEQTVSIETFNILGEKLIVENHFMKEGVTKLKLSINNAKGGIYFIRVRTANESFNKKIIVK